MLIDESRKVSSLPWIPALFNCISFHTFGVGLVDTLVCVSSKRDSPLAESARRVQTLTHDIVHFIDPHSWCLVDVTLSRTRSAAHFPSVMPVSNAPSSTSTTKMCYDNTKHVLVNSDLCFLSSFPFNLRN